jgi:transcriptional regulator with XRE-family HTH domain
MPPDAPQADPAAASPDERSGPVDDITGQVCRRVRQLRTKRGWSLEELSSLCGVSRSMLSQIERDQANPTLAVTLRIAQAFGLSIGELVDAPTPPPAIEVIRADDPTYHYRSDRDCRLRTLSPLHLEKDVEFYELRLNPKSELRSAAHFEGAREFLTVEKGRIRVESAEAAVELDPGDSANYRADVSHAIVNVGRGEAVVFLVVIYE